MWNNTSITPSKSTNNHQDLELIDGTKVDEQLKSIETAIKEILMKLNGHPYANFIRNIDSVESLSQEKKMWDWHWLIAIRVLQEVIKLWKEFIGSEIYRVLQENLIENTRATKEIYGMTDEEIKDNTDNIEIRTLNRTRKIMETNKIFEINTKWGVKFNSGKQRKTVPKPSESSRIIQNMESLGKLDNIKKALAFQNSNIILGQLHVQWPIDAKWTIPQLLIVIEVMNLIIAKIELTWVKTMIDAMYIMWQSVDGIINRK